jgi:hypothetical protein
VKGLGTFVAEKGKPLGCGCLCLRVRRVAEEDYTRGRGCDLRAAALFGLTRRGLLATLSSTVTHLNAERHNTRPADADPPAIWGRLQSLRRWMTAAHTRNAALHESGSVQVFGRRHDEPIGARWRPASEKRQGTKSRWVKHGRCSGLYGDLAASCVAEWFDCNGRRDCFVSRNVCACGREEVERGLRDRINSAAAGESGRPTQAVVLPAASRRE